MILYKVILVIDLYDRIQCSENQDINMFDYYILCERNYSNS